ncbi:Hypothetical protein CINCED_3A018482 [Cinara cedri]|uniref:Uncharacterized protein n=1 Tax=Cinara cedri TaxID=506608 RepID=A0A5E4NJW3_9HEMI|nr:Hypothetical protein CINCED_3A018482 [Cinara cedri]
MDILKPTLALSLRDEGFVEKTQFDNIYVLVKIITTNGDSELACILSAKPHSTDVDRLIFYYNLLKTATRSSLSPTVINNYLKQKPGENVITNATRIEHFQSIILELETSDQFVKVSKALEASLKAQTVQVFIEELGPFKESFCQKMGDFDL